MASSTTTSSASLATAGASAHRLIYEVFLSFRGEDTREGITSAIYDALQNKKEIKTFMDGYNVEVGDDISSTLLTAIKESRFAIVVLSKNYADSTWCLEELTTIFQNMKDQKSIMPLFYRVDPSDVRKQNGSFGDAFRKHESGESSHGTVKLKQWRAALKNVANLSGWDSKNYRSDKELVEDIEKFVWSKVLQVRIEDEAASREFVAFGATKLAMDKIMEGLQDDDVAVIGLYGKGGVGKTTLAKHTCTEVRANGTFNKVIMAVVSKSVDLKKIQAQLADMLALKFGKDIEANEDGRAGALKKTILRGNKLLIILDDIWSKLSLSKIGIPHNEELQKCNSKLLFTTREPKVCQEMNSDTKINLSILSEEDSWKLFLKKARLVFDESSEIYSVARVVARSCVGVPVALATVGRALRCEELEEWKKAAEKLHGSRPAVPEDEKHVSAPEDDKHVSASEDENHVSASEDEKHVSASEDEKHASSTEDEKHVSAPEDEKHVSPPEYEKHASPFEGEKHVSTPEDQKHVSAPEDEKQVSAAEDEKHVSPPEYEKHASPFEGEKHVSTPEDQKHVSAPEDEKHVSAAEDEKHASACEDEKHVSTLEDEKHVFNAIKLSYDYLKSADAKSFLLLCCLFPEDYDIPIEDLFKYGIGKGLFQDSKTLQEAREAADLVVESLKSSNLLLDSEKQGCVKMHDVVRDAAISISSPGDGQEMLVKSGQGLTEWPRISADIHYSVISLMDNQIGNPPEDLVCSKLVQILALKNSKIRLLPETLFQSQNELRILDIRSNFMDDLPESFNLLTNLRALFLCNNANLFVWMLAVIGKLGKLEILSFTMNWNFFPTELGQLSKLRILDISKPKLPNNDQFPPQVISSLIRLEELYMKGRFIWGRKDHEEWCGNQTDLCCEEFIGLPNLNVLEVQIHDVGCLPEVVEFNPHWVYFDITFNVNDLYRYFADLPHRQRLLRIDTSINSLPDWFHKVVTERTERLVYYWFRHMINILLEYGNGRLHEVKYLVVNRYNDASEWRELMNSLTWEVPDKPVFENLEELHVEDVPCVELCVGELPVGSFCNLKKFKVLDCLNMKNALLSSNLLNRLQNLEELLCSDLRSIKCVFGTDGMKPEQIIFTKLRKIHLYFLLKLKSIYTGPATPHAIFQNLKILIVSECSSLKYVFPSSSIVESLVQLEELYVSSCPKLEVVIRASEETNIEGMIEFPGLKILFLVNLSNLTRFYGISKRQCAKINCPKLEQKCFLGSIRFNRSSIRSLKEVQEGDWEYQRSINKRLEEDSKTRRWISWQERDVELKKICR